MKLHGVEWTLSIERESWGLEVGATLKKHRRAHFATLLTEGQSSSSCELAGGAWAALSVSKAGGMWKLNLLCRCDKALYSYQISLPVDPKHAEPESEIQPVWSLELADSVFRDSTDAQAQAGTALAMLLTNTPLENLQRDNNSSSDKDENALTAVGRGLSTLQ